AVVGIRLTNLREVAARGDSLVVVDDVDSSRRLIDRDPREPLRAVVAGPAVHDQWRRERRAAIGAALENDVGSVSGVVAGIHHVNGAGARASGVVHGNGWIRV